MAHLTHFFRPSPNPSASRRAPFPLTAGLLGALAGLTSACWISVNDGSWNSSKEECFDEYGDCMDDIDDPEDAEACELLLDSCLAACDRDDTGYGGDTDGGEGPGDGDPPGDGDGDPPPHAEDGGDGDGDPPPRAEDGGDGAGDGDGDGDGANPACFDLLATCVGEAETIQDIEACEALFDDCIDPGPCDECEEPGCPQNELDACVADYAECAELAVTAEDVFACEGAFDQCIAMFDVSLCLPNYDDDLVLACLEQHELCVACAEDADQFEACKTTFDNCLEG